MVVSAGAVDEVLVEGRGATGRVRGATCTSVSLPRRTTRLSGSTRSVRGTTEGKSVVLRRRKEQERLRDAPTTISTLILPFTQTSMRWSLEHTRIKKRRFCSNQSACDEMTSQSSAEHGETDISLARGREGMMESST